MQSETMGFVVEGDTYYHIHKAVMSPLYTHVLIPYNDLLSTYRHDMVNQLSSTLYPVFDCIRRVTIGELYKLEYDYPVFHT